MVEELKPFRINFKNKDQTIYMVQNQILKIFFRDDYGWLSVPDEMYNRTWSYIKRKGVTYLSDFELLGVVETVHKRLRLVNYKIEKETFYEFNKTY